ncbi:MAG: hypothetical protein ACYC1U_02390 [Candidatus Aquicultorales bacterium]
MRVKRIILLAVCLVALTAGAGCAKQNAATTTPKKEQQAAPDQKEDAKDKAKGQDQTKATVDEAETHAFAAATEIKAAFQAMDDLMNSSGEKTKAELGEVASFMRVSIDQGQAELDLAMKAIKELPESGGRDDYIAALNAQLDAARNLYGLASLLDNEEGFTSAFLASGEGALEQRLTELYDAVTSAMEQSNTLHDKALKGLDIEN